MDAYRFSSNLHVLISNLLFLCRALKNLNKFRLHGKQITLAWAPGKGMKEKQWKEFWDLDAGASFIPIEKLDPQVEIFKNPIGVCLQQKFGTVAQWIFLGQHD